MRVIVRTLAVVVCASLIGSGFLAGSAAAASACTSATLVPRVHAATAAQGQPYSPLVRGKDAAVKFFLTMPECSTATSPAPWLKTNAAALTVTIDGGAATGSDVPNENSLATPPAVAPYNRPSDNSTADPFFVVPGPHLAPAARTSAFTARFTVKLTYSGSMFSGTRQLSSSFTAPVHGTSNPLRVLAIPMGDPTGPNSPVNNTVPQFSTGESSAESAVIDGFATMARMFPVFQGTGNMATNSGGGIRYTIDRGALVDVREFMTSGLTEGQKKFCGNESNVTQVRAKLANYLVQYNTANSLLDAADRVLGVIDEAITSSACAAGYAGVGTREAWAKAFRTSYKTGSVIAMEEAHNSGAVSPLRDNDNDPTHGQLTYADSPSPGKTWNLLKRSWISDDRSVMKYTGQPAGWDDSRTLLEKGDWEQIFCRLGGPVTTDCHTVGTEGGVQGSGAGNPQFNVVGLTDGTPGGTQIFDSYLAPGPTDQVKGTEYFFVQRESAGGAALATQPVAVHQDHSVHEAPVEVASHPNFFSFSYSAHPSAGRWELWKGTPGAADSVLLTARDKAPAPVASAPTLEIPQAAARNVNFDDASMLDDAPGRYADRGVTFEDDSGQTPRIFADLTASTTPNTLINDAQLEDGVSVPLVGGPAPLGMQFAFDVERVGMRIGNGLPGVTATLTGFDADGEEVASTTVPSFSKPVSTLIEIESSAGDIVRAELAYTEGAGAGSTQSEQIDDLSFTPTRGSIYDATVTMTGDNPGSFVGAFFAKCPDSNLPLAVGLAPTEVAGNTATFTYRFDPSTVCGDGQKAALMFRGNDGYNSTPFTAAVEVPAPDAAPLVVISEPSIDTSTIEHSSLALAGQAYDPNTGVVVPSKLEWFLTGPGFAERAVGTGANLSVRPPSGGKWTPGDYVVRLKATDPTGQSSSATATLTVLRDEDNDGIPERDEACFAGPSDPEPDKNPFNAYEDADGDGHDNSEDPDVCVAAETYVFEVDFDPDTLNTGSNGNDVMAYIKSESRDLRDVVPSTIRLATINGVPVTPADPDFNGVPASWSVGTDGIGTAKFDRQALFDFIERENLFNQFVLMTFTGQGTTGDDAWSWEASDAPYVRQK